MLPNFRGRTVSIIGGGPSLKSFDLSSIPADWAKIAVNNSYQLVPDADLLFFADARWYQAHYPALHKAWRGRMVSPCSDHRKVPPQEVFKIAREYNAPIGEISGTNFSDPKTCKVAGRDSGTMAVNFAWHCGATEIVLFGFDMTFVDGQSHWHEGHEWPTTQVRYEQMFAPILAQMADILTSRSVRISRATNPGLPNIPYREVSQCVRTGA